MIGPDKGYIDGFGLRAGVRALPLQLINGALDEILTADEDDLDGDSRFCLAWFGQRGHQPGPFGEVDVLTQRGGKVRLLKRDELPEDWDLASGTDALWTPKGPRRPAPSPTALPDLRPQRLGRGSAGVQHACPAVARRPTARRPGQPAGDDVLKRSAVGGRGCELVV